MDLPLNTPLPQRVSLCSLFVLWLQAAQSRLAGNSQAMTMQDIARRREESLANYRRQYELQHPNHRQQAAQTRTIYQSDSSHALNDYCSDGFDEIDA